MRPSLLFIQGEHGVVDELADLFAVGVGLAPGPAGRGRDPEDVCGEVFVLIFEHGVAGGCFGDVVVAAAGSATSTWRIW